MKVLIAPDSFKESMSAARAASAISRGLRRVYPSAHVIELPLSDGGEGLVNVLVTRQNGQLHSAKVHDCLNRPTTAQFGWIPASRTAVIESAQANGLELIAPSDRDALAASTRGVGELILAALDLKPDTIVMGLGGSATTDLGAGMLQALGAELLDTNGNQVRPGGAALENLAHADFSGLDQRLRQVSLIAACDVDNPLLGQRGTARVFAKQKGASLADSETLEVALTHAHGVMADALGHPFAQVPGAGAAGGLGAAIVGPLHGQLKRGIDVVLDGVDFDRLLDSVDLVVTGEGAIDAQTRSGKVPWGVAKRALKRGIPTIAFAGKIGQDAHELDDMFTAILPIVAEVCDEQTALANGEANLETAAHTAFAMLKLGDRMKL